MATRHRVSCDRDEGERQRWAWESELRSGLSCNDDEGERQKRESDWDFERVRKRSGLSYDSVMATRERGIDERVRVLRKKSGLSCDSATATRERGRDERVIETWESEDWEWFLREAETREVEMRVWLREGFRVRKRLRVIFERGLKKKGGMTPYRGGEKGWNDVV